MSEIPWPLVRGATPLAARRGVPRCRLVLDGAAPGSGPEVAMSLVQAQALAEQHGAQGWTVFPPQSARAATLDRADGSRETRRVAPSAEAAASPAPEPVAPEPEPPGPPEPPAVLAPQPEPEPGAATATGDPAEPGEPSAPAAAEPEAPPFDPEQIPPPEGELTAAPAPDAAEPATAEALGA